MSKFKRLIGKGKRKENSTTLPPLESRNQEALAALRIDDTNPTLAAPRSVANVPKQTIRTVGLIELSTNKSEKVIDLVAVHGLQGDAYQTWEHANGSLWLRDFLPTGIPDARIMTFGYDSTVAFNKSVADIEDKALELLNHLSGKRSPAAPGGLSKPIVFICHSLGGIVVKKALILAHECDSNLGYKDILENTKAIAFLGVPHKGSDIAWWGTFAANLLKGASIGTSTNTTLISDLKRGSPTLAQISKQSVNRIQNMILYTFYETQKLNGVMVVDKQSAQIGLPNETLFPVNADHRTICKIPSSTSHEYQTVGSEIAKLSQKVLANAVSGGMILKAETPSFYEVPNRRVRQFVGREDILQRIYESLSTGPGPCIAVLQGMGGQGKSQIALEYCYRKKDILYPAIFWIDATTEESVKGSFQAISELIKKPTDILSDIRARVDLVLQTLSSWLVQWFLVFDNYDNPTAFPNIADFIPQSGRGAVLITSRHADSDALVLGQSNHLIELHGLDEEAAILLLAQRSQTKDSDYRHAKEIVERLCYHPLAITQAGAYIKKRGLQLSDFMIYYKKQREAILKNTPPLSQYSKKLGNAEGETSLNVFTTWELSFDQLRSQVSRDNVESKLLTLFAFFDNKDISEQMFAEYKANNSEIAKLLTWLNDFTNTGGEWDSELFATALINLRDLSLLQGFTKSPDGFYHSSLHPLIKDWIQLRTSKPIRQENTYMAAALVGKIIVNSWHKNHVELSLSTQQNILSHVMTLEEASQEFSVSPVNTPSNQRIFNEYITIQACFANFLSEIGSYQLAVILNQQVAVHLKKILGLEHPDTLVSMNNLASVFSHQGRWKEAKELGVQVMETSKRVLGLDHPITLASMNNLAPAFLHQGRLKEAEELGMQVIETSKRVLGLDHPNTLASMSNLASAFSHQGRLKEAEELWVQVIATRKRMLGLDHLDTLASMNNLALAFSHQGQWKEAEELGVQVMEMRKRVLGLDHPNTLTTINNLALAFSHQGRWKEAEELRVQVMETRKRVLGLEHPDTLRSMSNLVLAFLRQGRWKEAEELGVQVMETRKRVLGLEHPDTLTSMGNLALNFWRQDQKNQAIQLMTEVVQLSREVIGSDHYFTKNSIRILQEWQDEME